MSSAGNADVSTSELLFVSSRSNASKYCRNGDGRSSQDNQTVQGAVGIQQRTNIEPSTSWKQSPAAVNVIESNERNVVRAIDKREKVIDQARF